MQEWDFCRENFPAEFLFGVAGSSYQIEGHRFGGAGSTHWDSFAATPGNVAGGDTGAVACDHYHRFPEDIALAASAGFDAWRFSTSWARIFPDGEGAPNPEGLDFYDRLVDEICGRSLQPWLTLYHWELPSQLADKGGWTNREIPLRFADFAATVMKRIGDRVASVAPINEPWCVAWLSHFLGQHAPGLRDIRATARAMHHVPLAHGLAVEACRAEGHENVGLVVNFEFSQAEDDSENAACAAKLYDEIYNRWFIGAMRKGAYPEAALKGLERHLPENWEADLARISAPVDWIGANYYTRKIIGPLGTGQFPDFREVPGSLPKTDMGWEIYPDGLTHFLHMIGNEYADGLPIFVTENGMASPDCPSNGTVEDPARIGYLLDHLQATRTAIENGIDVRGYFVWSLLDNYEWAYGYGKRFGLVHVNFDTLERIPKSSLRFLEASIGRWD